MLVCIIIFQGQPLWNSQLLFLVYKTRCLSVRTVFSLGAGLDYIPLGLGFIVVDDKLIPEPWHDDNNIIIISLFNMQAQ
jgi:hypothetical protein